MGNSKENLINQIIELIDNLIDETENDIDPEFHYKLYEMIIVFNDNSDVYKNRRKDFSKKLDDIFKYPSKLF
jgi:hypothetical protein